MDYEIETSLSCQIEISSLGQLRHLRHGTGCQTKWQKCHCLNTTKHNCHVRPVQQKESTNLQGRDCSLQSNLLNWPLIWALPPHAVPETPVPELSSMPQQPATNTPAPPCYFSKENGSEGHLTISFIKTDSDGKKSCLQNVNRDFIAPSLHFYHIR